MRVITLIDDNMQWATRENAYLDADGIQKLLEHFNSWLKSYEMKKGFLFSAWLFEACCEYGIEPIMALAMLQKEASLIQKYKWPVKPADGVIDWCCGYGCPESGGRKKEFKGFEKQITSMLASFQKYIDDAPKKWPSIRSWKTWPVELYDDGGKTGEKVLAGNLETALHLLYNPRIDGDGVDLLKNIWDRYYREANELNLIEGDY